MAKKNSNDHPPLHGGQEHPEADNEKSESDQDNEAETGEVNLPVDVSALYGPLPGGRPLFEDF